MHDAIDYDAILEQEPELPTAGTEVGEYEILEPVGVGGYSVVFLAFHARLDREVALKIIRPSATRKNPGLAKRFLREIDLVSRLEHPNTVRLYDFGQTEDGLLWMATELIRGRMLSSILEEEGAFSFVRTRKIALQILSGLVEAHESGIIHCDLKPNNIMLTRKGAHWDWVQILDFGIATVITAETDFDLEEPSETPKPTAAVQGTPRYMAPEQFKKQNIGAHTDVYAMGLVLFEMLTGRPAIEGQNLKTIIQSIMAEPLPFPEALEGSEIAEIISRATEIDYNARFSSAMALYNAIEACGGEDEAAGAILATDVDMDDEDDDELIAPPLPAPPTSAALDLPDHRSAHPQIGLPDPSSAQHQHQNRQQRGLLVVAILIILLLLFGIGAFAIFSGGDRSEQPPIATNTTSALTEDTAAREGEGEGEDEDKDMNTNTNADSDEDNTPPEDEEDTNEVTWSLTSQPEGAMVKRDGDVICEKTPCKTTIIKSEEPVEFTFELNGYVRENASFRPEQSGQIVIPLRRTRVQTIEAPGGKGKGEGASGGPDPFNVPHH